MSWRAIAIRLAVAGTECRCSAVRGMPHDAYYAVEWQWVESDQTKRSGRIAVQHHCMARAGAIAREFNLQPFPFGPDVKEARCPSTNQATSPANEPGNAGSGAGIGAPSQAAASAASGISNESAGDASAGTAPSAPSSHSFPKSPSTPASTRSTRPPTIFTIPPGTPMATCGSCHANVRFIRTHRGKLMPVNLDGTSHFINCEHAGAHRRRRRRA